MIARGGGKTDAGIVWLLKGVNDPNYIGLCIRRNYSDLRNWLDRAKQLFTTATCTGNPAVFKFPSGAKIYTGHLSQADSYTQFQGWEIHRLLIEELGQIPSEDAYLKLISSVRSTSDVKPQIFLTCNPGGSGHQWIKKRFKINVKKSNVAFKDDISGRKRIYIPATIDDNPTLKNLDPDYVKFLDALPEPMRSAWRNGDWDVFAGQYFKEFDPRIHCISEDKAKTMGYGEEHNNRYIGIDWGYSAPFGAVWIEVTPDNRVFCYRELYGREKHPMEWAELINKMTTEEITMSLGDPSMWTRNPMSWNNPSTQMYSDRSIANALIGDISRPLVPNLQPANNDRVNGWRNIAQLMHYSNKVKPNFYIINGTCPNLTRTIPDMICDEKRPEDIDTTLEDHICDALRYALTHIQAPNKPRKKLTKDQIRYQQLLIPGSKKYTMEFK
ncbi:MAG: hypothetical protein CMP21_08765 [Rickettsiales bacterium]|nr:hypothetical protein [Rickettsiales bacterium]